MKIITWNCQGGFRFKYDAIAKYEPDLAIIQECESPDKLINTRLPLLPEHSFWMGDNPHKGVGVFSFTGLKFKLNSLYDETIKFCVPIKVTGTYPLNLLAVWAKSHSNRDLSYIGQVHKAVHLYSEFLGERETILVGDLNSNTIWDSGRNNINHSTVVKFLDDIGLASVYHAYYQEEQGNEKMPTFYLTRNKSRPFHIDYCFVPKNWIPGIKSFWVGDYEDWKDLSDHCPLYFEWQ